MSPEAPKPSDESRRRILFSAGATTFFRVALVAVALIGTATAVGIFSYYHSPYWHRAGFAPDQPVLFSHRHHAGELRIDCRYCHATVETSAFAGMPATQTCLNCHSQLFTDTAMLAPVVHSATAGEPLVWTQVTRIPAHVYFNHSIHVAKGVSCTACHGDIGRMALTAKAKPLDMRECIDCHRDPAPRLRPHDELFAAIAANQSFSASSDLMRRNGVHAQHLTNCSTCHH